VIVAVSDGRAGDEDGDEDDHEDEDGL